jgi:hypothetical protein
MKGGIKMAVGKLKKVSFRLTGLGLWLLLLLTTAQALPSFARQTGMRCNACHTIFPELTPFGRIFKLGGYALSKTGKPYESVLPLAGMVQASFTESKGLTSGIAPFDSAHRVTDKFNLPQQVSLFYGRRLCAGDLRWCQQPGFPGPDGHTLFKQHHRVGQKRDLRAYSQ